MRTPNKVLAERLDRSGMSRGELARRVRAKAIEWGHRGVAPDATRVRRWLEGEQPRPPIPELVAAVLSEKAGYHITTYDVGLGESRAAESALLYSASYTATVDVVSDLGRADVDRRKILTTAPWAAVAGVGPSRDWLMNTLDQQPAPGPRVVPQDVDAVRNMFKTFQQMDIFQGGGAGGRLVLAEYMTQHVYPLLAKAHNDDVRRSLCVAASEQTYLLGWMAYDDGEHGIAQRYLIQSLRLAEESQDAALGAHVLAGMADQATLLGDPAEGRRLAQAGRHGLRAASPACLADLWALEARALALLGDRAAATRAVAASERAYERARLDQEPTWAAYIDIAYLHGEHANTFRDLGDSAATREHAQRSIKDAREQGRARRGAMSHAALASAHLHRRDLDSAYAAGLRTLSLTKQVHSSRAVEAVQDLQRRMAPFGKNRLVADFTERARELVTAA